MIKCGLDLGGSQVRYGVTADCIRVIEAKTMEISPDAPTKDYASDDVLSDFIIRKHPMVRLCGRRFVRGDAMDHYKGTVLYCDNQTVKVEQEITYINAAYEIARDCMLQYYDDQEVQITACIPTSEYYSEGSLVSDFKTNLTGEFEIEFPRSNKSVSFTVSPGNVRVTPEGVVAVYKYGNKDEFREGITCVIDVGHRSTDITLLKNFAPIGNSAVSRTKGGINVISFIRSAMERDNTLLNTEEVEQALSHRFIIKDDKLVDVTDLVDKAGNDKEALKAMLLSQYGTVTPADTDNAMNKYFVRQGAGITDITSYVTAAKKAFCASLKDDIIDVLAVEMRNIASINNIVPIGRLFTGDPESPDNAINILMDVLYPGQNSNSRARVYSSGNLALANIKEIMNLIDASSAN